MEASRGVLSKHKVNVNVQALRNGSGVQAVTDLRNSVVTPDAGAGFLMQLPGGSAITLITNRLQSYVEGVETYSGRVEGNESGFFTLSIEDDKVYGQVNIEYIAYDLRFDEVYSSHVLTEIDQARVPRHSPEPLSDGAAYTATPQGSSSLTLFSGSINGTVRVLILHASDVPNPTTLASNIISTMNDTYFNDGFDPDFHVTLADLRNLNNDLDGVCKEDILSRMENGTSPFANIATWIDDENADVVLTIATTDPSVTNCSINGIYGLNEARWNAVSTAENYQLLRSHYSNFSSPSVLYFGPATSVDVTVAINQTLYLKVRACNGSGCSDLSAQKTATYYNGCL
jgi:hypothetical protein